MYDIPTKDDGVRILVDRLWPRGLKKEEAQIDIWAKELTPSNELRQWFHDDKQGRFFQFKSKYRKELAQNKDRIKELPRRKRLTLVTAVKDIERSHIPVLKSFLERHM